MIPGLPLSARAFALVASAVAIVIGVLACRQLVGITDNPPEDLVTSICGLPYGTNVCASCVSASCCAESTACASDPTCAAYEGCVGKCNGDPKCRSECTTYPVSTASDVSALSPGVALNCETACGLTCGGIANLITESPSAASCQSCIEKTATACTDARAWGTSVDGDAYWRCVLACPTEDCKLTCGTDHPSGASLFATFHTDYGGTCAGPCAYGKYWACVGELNWPVAKATTIIGSFSVVNQNGSPVSGLDVSFCSICPCGTAADPLLGKGFQTDDAGTVEYTIPRVLDVDGIGPGIGLDGCVQVTSPDNSYIPVFAYWGYPISEPVKHDPDALPVETPDALSSSLQLIGVAQDPMRGWVSMSVHDCLDRLPEYGLLPAATI